MPASKPRINYDWIAKQLKNGRVVPFLGAGASISCGLPSGSKLAEILVREGKFPDTDGRDNLARAASYLAHINGDSNLLDTLLRDNFNIVVKPSALHECLASIEALQLIVTTNYDDLIEQAFGKREPLVVVDRGKPGNVYLRGTDRPWQLVEARLLEREIEKLNKETLSRKITDISEKLRRKQIDENQAASLTKGANDSRPIIFKMHGSLDRKDWRNDAFLITEEHYVDFLGKKDPIPSMLQTMMQSQNFLFLGYGLKDWNVRVMLRKLMQMRPLAQKIVSWAIVHEASPSEKALWRAHDVSMFEVDLDVFTEKLRERLKR